MSHLIRKQQVRAMRRRQAFGSLASDGMGSLGDDLGTNIATAVEVASEVASDPYLAEMLCHVKQLGQIERHQPVQSCFETPVFGAGSPTSTAGGVGLKYAVLPARAFVFARQNPVMWILGAAVVLGLPMLAGYTIGRSKG